MATPYDQAYVRRDGAKWKRLAGLPLCEVCGVQSTCTLTQALNTLAGQKAARVQVGECAGFMPVISFQDPTGIFGRFNTFRRGRGWANRVVQGQRVALFDMAGRGLLGTAEVEIVEHAPLGELLEAHAPMNHLMKSKPEHEASALLHRVLKRLYGNTYAAASETFSVIGMKMEE
jgi:hypothetical protein